MSAKRDEKMCGECGDGLLDADGVCKYCRCATCGESTTKGEGYDGLCGNCADRAQTQGECPRCDDMWGNAYTPCTCGRVPDCMVRS